MTCRMTDRDNDDKAQMVVVAQKILLPPSVSDLQLLQEGLAIRYYYELDHRRCCIAISAHHSIFITLPLYLLHFGHSYHLGKPYYSSPCE